MVTQRNSDAEKAGSLIQMFNSIPRLVSAFNTLSGHLEQEVVGMSPGDQITAEMVDMFEELIEISRSIHTAIVILGCVPDPEVRVALGKVILGEPWDNLMIYGEPALKKATVYLFQHHRELEQRFKRLIPLEA